MNRVRISLVIPILFVCGCRGQLPIVGFDEDGKVIETLINQKEYASRLGASVTSLQESAIPAFDSTYGRKLSGLREARLGLGLRGDVGLGEYFKLGGNIGFRLGFTNRQ